MRARLMRVLTCAAVVALVAASCCTATSAAAAAPGCAAAKGVYRQSTPWPQRLLDPERIWPLTDGTGQTVAVIGTGIDARNAQFDRGQVLPGVDLLGSAARPANTDCDGRGTFAAGIVGAQPDPSTTFAGLAPGARLLPIRYTESAGGSAPAGDPNRLAAAIRTASAAHAKVILVVVPAESDSASLRNAVSDARRSGAVVISPAAAAQAGERTYPTADPHAIGVGAVDEHGAAVQVEADDGIALAAPGADLVSTAPGRVGQSWGVKDPEFAAAYVAGAVALMLAYRPGLSPSQILARLTLTADRTATTGRDPRLGWGVVDPYAALTAALPADAAAPGAAATPTAANRRIAPAAAPPPSHAPDRRPGVVAILAIALAVTTGVAAMAARRGRLRRWRSGRLGRVS